MSESSNPVASFVKGFFSYLDGKRIEAAVLHGWHGGFESDLSDVDFVTETATFNRLPELVDAWCESQAWQLCQILYHETTAAYFVCSSKADPTQAVALDACSDYRRNGTILIPADVLLKGRVPLPWGGHRVADAMVLRYRFAKAAVKKKSVVACVEEFAEYPQEARDSCHVWLRQTWGVRLEAWDEFSLEVALKSILAKSNTRPSLSSPAELKRIILRVLYPTGMVVITGECTSNERTAQLSERFSHLYFRHSKVAQHWRLSLLKHLITSGIILIPRIGPIWSSLIPSSCIHRLNPDQDFGTQSKALVSHLHQRCRLHERL
jgi:hypothetical protein